MNIFLKHKDNKEMENKKKIRLGWLAFLFVIFHFTTILITTLPEKLTPKIAQTVSNYYVTPLFNQKWSMFAPCPLIKHQLKLKFYFKDKVTDTITPSEDYFKYHAWLRFTHHGDLATGEYNMMYWLKFDLDKLNIKPNSTLLISQKKAFYKTRGYFLLNNYLKGYALKHFKQYQLKTDVFLNYYDVKKQKLNTYILKNLK